MTRIFHENFNSIGINWNQQYLGALQRVVGIGVICGTELNRKISRQKMIMEEEVL